MATADESATARPAPPIADAEPPSRELPILRGSLWQQLVLLFAVILLPPTILSGVLAWDSFSEHTRRAMLSVRQFAVLAATYERRFFEDTRERLQRMSGDPAIQQADLAACAELLTRTLEAYPEFAELHYHDTDGEQVCGTGPGATDVSTWPWFQDVVLFRSFTISDYTFSSGSPRPVIVAALPVNSADGELRGVLSASIELTWLASFLREARLPADGVFFLLDSNGNVLASSSSLFGSSNPALPKAESRDSAPPETGPGSLNQVVRADLVDDVIKRRLVDFEAIGKDDVRRVYSSVALPHGNVTLLFGVPADVAFGWIERDLVMRILSLVAIWVAGIVAAWLGTRWLVTRWIAPLRDMAHAYGRGDYSASRALDRAPLELRDFGEALRRMASRIEAREEDLRESLTQKDVLLREIHHRVKNNLQIVSSLLNIHGGGGSAERRVLEEIKTRVRALALVHRYLYEGDDVQLVALRSFLTELCSTLVRSLTDRNRRIRLDIDLPELDVLSDRAVPIALFVTEVMTNSLKHAFPDERPGCISVRFLFGEDSSCVLEVADDGIGAPEQTGQERTGQERTGTTATTGSGLGSQLMSAFAAQLNGKLSVVRNGGTTVRLGLDIRSLTDQSFHPAPES